MDIQDFQTRQSFGESQQFLMAAAVILRAAFGEVASCNALCAREVLSSNQQKTADRAFRQLMKIMGMCCDAYRLKCNELDASDRKSN